MSEFRYAGSELELFADARNWKNYFCGKLRPYLGEEVVEVGAGLGSTSRLLSKGLEKRWLCLEPDAALARAIEGRVRAGELPACCEVQVRTLAELDAGERFDTILYIDVLEHIEDDRAELATAARFLRPGGRLAVLSPARQFLFSDFDRAIGHHRRYDKRGLRAVVPEGLEEERVFYLDSAGMLASMANRFLLRQSSPSAKQIQTWDRLLVPISRVLDRLLAHRLGKSIVGIWRKP